MIAKPLDLRPERLGQLQRAKRRSVHSDISIGQGVTFGWAVRKDSPKLLAESNEFIKTHRQGAAFVQQLDTKYTGSTYKLKQAVSADGMTRFEQTAQYFRKYSDQDGMDYLLMMAEGYQESGLNQQAKSQAGAVGVMQVMTGKDMDVGDVHVTFEEGTWVAWLYDLLKPRVAKLVVCDPRRNALLQEGNQNDRVDARKLAELPQNNQLRSVYQGDHGLRTLKELVCSYLTITQDLTRVMSRVKAIYRSWTIPSTGKQV